jgi:hypothetical protein
MTKTKTSYTLTFIAVFIFGAIIYFYKNPIPTQHINVYKCPEVYTEDADDTAEYKDALTKWTSEFFKENPKATMSDWSIAKTKLWVDNNCTVALQKSKMSGKVSDLKPWERVDYEIQNALDKVAY